MVPGVRSEISVEAYSLSCARLRPVKAESPIHAPSLKRDKPNSSEGAPSRSRANGKFD